MIQEVTQNTPKKFILCRMSNSWNLGGNKSTWFIKFNNCTNIRMDRDECIIDLIHSFINSKQMTHDLDTHCTDDIISNKNYNIILFFDDVQEIYDNLPEMFI